MTSAVTGTQTRLGPRNILVVGQQLNVTTRYAFKLSRRFLYSLFCGKLETLACLFRLTYPPQPGFRFLRSIGFQPGSQRLWIVLCDL